VGETILDEGSKILFWHNGLVVLHQIFLAGCSPEGGSRFRAPIGNSHVDGYFSCTCVDGVLLLGRVRSYTLHVLFLHKLLAQRKAHFGRVNQGQFGEHDLCLGQGTIDT
jgi:hypothetical protein